MTVSPERRKYAAQLDADCARLEKIGTVAAGKIGRKVRIAALTAYRAGNDPSGAIREPLGDMAPLLADAMVAAWLTARWRVLKTVEARQAKTVKLSTAYDNAIQALKAQMHVGDLSIDQLRDAFVPDVLAKLHDMNRATQGRITTKMLELTQRQVHVTEGIRELQGVFTAAGITPENSYTLENIFRTQTQLAYGAGRWAALHEPEIDDILWGFEYSTVGDDRVRSSHAAMDGVRLPKDHSFWQTNWPPNGWSCRCQALEIFEGDDLAKESKIILPAPKTVDGVTFQPEADRGFGFNPGQRYSINIIARDVVSAQETIGRAIITSGVPKDMRDAMDTVVSEISRVHKLPDDFHAVPLKVVDRIRSKEGYTTQAQLKVTKYEYGGIRPTALEIIKNAGHPHISLLHEVGHLIDIDGIVPPYSAYSTESSLASPDVKNLLVAIRRSKSYRTLRLNKDYENEFKEYLLEDKELFARAYSQLIATRGDDDTIKDELRALRRDEKHRPLFWSQKDFEPISEAMDKVVGRWK